MNYGTALINKAKKSAVGLGIKKNCAVAFAIKKLEQMLVYFWLDMTGKCQLGNGSCYQYTSKACSQGPNKPTYMYLMTSRLVICMRHHYPLSIISRLPHSDMLP